MSRTTLAIVVAVVLILVAVIYSLLRGPLQPDPICYETKYDPCNNCQPYEEEIECPSGTVMHFTSSGGLNFDGGGGGGGAESLVAESTIPEYDTLKKCFSNIPEDPIDSSRDGMVNFTIDFHVAVDCGFVPNNDNNITCKTSQTDTVNDVSFEVKLFKNGELLTDPPEFSFSVRSGDAFSSRDSDNLKLTPNDYYYECYLRKDTFLADCIATVRLTGEYEVTPTSSHALVFCLTDHARDYHTHELQSYGLSCITEEMLESFDRFFVADHMLDAHKDVFSLQEIQRRLKAIKDKGELDRFITSSGDNALTTLASCYAVSDTLLAHYECLEQTNCHVADHTDIVYLPGLCTQ